MYNRHALEIANFASDEVTNVECLLYMYIAIAFIKSKISDAKNYKILVNCALN
jgi:hypothetical protein